MADFELQYLKHGKALCGKVFGTFVETFNRLVDFHANLKGDGDVSDDGLVTVDRADPAHPVIRLDRSKLPTGGSSGGGEGDDEPGEDDEAACVTSLNSETGDMAVIGGKGIEVTTDGKTIKITANAEKSEEDEDPNAEPENPCDHDESGRHGGVSPDGGSGQGGSGGGVGSESDGNGGVAGGGEPHTGDDDCNC